MALRLSVTVGILSYLFRRVPISDVMAAMATAHARSLLLAFVLCVLTHFIAGYRLMLLTDRQGISVSTAQAVEINLAAIFYGLSLPGGNLTGGVIRFYRLAGQERKMAKAFAALACDRVVATVTLCLLGIVFWMVNRPPESGYIGLSMVAVLGGLIISALLLAQGGVADWFDDYLERGRGVFFFSKVMRLSSTLARYRDLSLKSVALILVLSMASHLLGILAWYLLGISVKVDLSLATMGWVRSAVLLITLVPISISGLGVREGAVVFLLEPYGVSRAKRMAFSFLVFGVTVLTMGALGGLLEGRRTLSRMVSKLAARREKRANGRR